MRLIDMDTLWQCETCFHHKANGCDTWCDAGEAYRPAASKLKVIAPESLRPKGEWIMRGGKLYCSHCGERAGVARDRDDFWYTKGTDACPNCGADMRGENK